MFRTYEPSRDRLVAVKAFRLDIVPEQAQALAVALSRAAQASLFHPSIVEPIDAGIEGTVAYRAEEYVAAESLDVAMRHYAPAPIEKALPFITQLAGAIDFARAAGIGHGGLHPRDIFVTPDEARATGFGVVDALEQVGIRAPIRRPYSAPERIDGRAWGTPADVFSLAAIAFELLTGKRPAGSGAEIGALPEGAFAPAMHAVLARAMDDDPSRRYASALAFAGALEAASQGRPLTDAASQVAAIAEVAEPETVSIPPPAIPQTHADLYEEPEAPVATDGPLPLPVIERTPPFDEGEFAIEAALDPTHVAINDLRAAPEAEQAFARPHEAVEPSPVSLFAVDEEAGVSDRFTDDFAHEQTEPDLRSPLEAEPAYEPPKRVEPPMFRSVAPEPDSPEPVEHGRPTILPYALVAVPVLLVGFAAGYFVGSRDRITSGEPASAVAQYSEQKVSPAAAEESKAAAPKAPEPNPTAPASGGAAPVERRPAETKAPDTKATDTKPAETKAPPPSRGAVAQNGQIFVRSLPTRAGVTINGAWRGRTPLKLDGLAFGSYSVRVVQPGYQVLREDVTLNAGAPSHTVTARLERAVPPAATAAPSKPAPAAKSAAAEDTFSGSLYVDSRPRGATVMIDGKTVGQTPLSVPDVRAGSHVVRIEMDGKKPVTANPRVMAGKTERVTVSLEDK